MKTKEEKGVLASKKRIFEEKKWKMVKKPAKKKSRRKKVNKMEENGTQPHETENWKKKEGKWHLIRRKWKTTWKNENEKENGIPADDKEN